MANKGTYNDREWIKAHGLAGLAQDSHVKRGGGPPMPEPALFGHDLFGHPIEQPSRGKVADDFVCPPFTVLSSREGWWQERKAGWIGRGIKSEVGRGDALLIGNGCNESGLNHYRDVEAARAASPGGNMLPAMRQPKNGITTRGTGAGEDIGVVRNGKPVSTKANLGAIGCPAHAYDSGGEGGNVSKSGTSIFDPVLCELVYRWFCPPAGLALDPFAGGSVRGIVAVLLGRHYYGIELRREQVTANFEQAERICPDAPPAWICGDARAELPAAPRADLVFSCPPYADLERYSDDPRDLSTMGWTAFLDAYRAIVAAACARLRPDRFACFVVGDVRDKDGLYRNLPGETIRAFTDAGLRLYNEAILATPVGSLPIRINAQFSKSRKLGKTHQNILVFVKGCPRRAAAAIPIMGDTP